MSSGDSRSNGANVGNPLGRDAAASQGGGGREEKVFLFPNETSCTSRPALLRDKTPKLTAYDQREKEALVTTLQRQRRVVTAAVEWRIRSSCGAQWAVTSWQKTSPSENSWANSATLGGSKRREQVVAHSKFATVPDFKTENRLKSLKYG